MGFLQQRHHLRLCGCAGSSCIRCRRNALNVALATHHLHERRIRCIRCRRNALNVADSAGWAVVLDSALHPLPAQRAQCSHKHPFASYALERPQSGGPLGFADRPFARSGLRRARPGGRRYPAVGNWNGATGDSYPQHGGRSKAIFLQHFADGLFRFVDLESKGNGRRLAIWMDRHHEFIRLLH
jgi:hypothetical protein